MSERFFCARKLGWARPTLTISTIITSSKIPSCDVMKLRKPRQKLGATTGAGVVFGNGVTVIEYYFLANKVVYCVLCKINFESANKSGVASAGERQPDKASARSNSSVIKSSTRPTPASPSKAKPQSSGRPNSTAFAP